MKFRTPPEWPPAPEGWIPDPGWQPEPTWPAPPRNWDYWVNDYGVPVAGPPGVYGGGKSPRRWLGPALTGVGVFCALLFGIGLGATPPAESAAAPLADIPTHTVTVVAAPAPTVTRTSPPETVTLPAETVTLPVETVTIIASAAAPKATAAAPLAPQQPKSTAPSSAAPAPANSAPQNCVIKGNISSSGERIYHVPGGGSYAVTKIDQGKGERWFCSEQEARNAGWRKARN